LRSLAVGKEVSFTTIHSLSSSTDEVSRDLGYAEINGTDLTTELLRAGWAKLKEIKREPSEEDLKKREIEAEAKAAGRGIWNPHGQTVRYLLYLNLPRL
jgi:staphylococcal nuclease domain-containing protein 1